MTDALRTTNFTVRVLPDFLPPLTGEEPQFQSAPFPVRGRGDILAASSKMLRTGI